MRTLMILIPFGLIFFSMTCGKSGQAGNEQSVAKVENEEITTMGADLRMGAERSDIYLPILDGKRIGLVVNHTSMVGEVHLVEYLLGQGVEVVKIFVPEHGFRGTADAGEAVANSVDEQTGLPVISLYGKNKKPDAGTLKDVDVLIFDIQDVGVRFYTYISTMHYIMEAAAENDRTVMVFDRPNPNGHYIDGPILEPAHVSFVGIHPIPIVHGLTVAELAKMINGEGWLKNGMQCSLEVVPMQNYKHNMPYSLPVKPSPNLPNDRSINLYPSICFFEGTHMSLGRGTQYPFQVLGYPDPSFGDFTFTPVSIDGMSKNPPLKDQKCYGIDLREGPMLDRIDLSYVIHFYKKWKSTESFFKPHFTLLAGTKSLEEQIRAGWTEEQIRESWKPGLENYQRIREKYLMY